MTEDNYKLEFKEAELRTTLAFIRISASKDTIFINDNALQEYFSYLETEIEAIIEHESIHLAILNAVGEHETRAYDKIHKNVDRIFW
jgi:predicted SprT family Zn-dependent metalloprotease